MTDDRLTSLEVAQRQLHDANIRYSRDRKWLLLAVLLLVAKLVVDETWTLPSYVESKVAARLEQAVRDGVGSELVGQYRQECARLLRKAEEDANTIGGILDRLTQEQPIFAGDTVELVRNHKAIRIDDYKAVEEYGPDEEMPSHFLSWRGWAPGEGSKHSDTVFSVHRAPR